jgi:SNF2 family DNA or RNA helicase
MRKSEKWVVSDGCGNYITPARDLSHMYASILSGEEYPFAMTSMRKDAKRIHDKTKTLNGLMDHLENLGHAVAPFVEGLAVELLPFQSQTVQWATEREQTPGGVNAFLWTKLPSLAQPHTDLYFSPILEELTVTKPQLARGGIIAEQMGLGKTVISLALILRNPAPPLPVSGTAIASINVTPAISSGAAFWDPDLYSRTSASKKKRGQIISRGTLVVVRSWMSRIAM